MQLYFSTLLIFALGGTFFGVEAGADHRKLLADLLKGYDVNERPVEHEDDTITLEFGLTIVSLVEVNIAQGYLETNLWLSMEWNDFYLKWNESNYGGIKTISLSADKIWKPDIFLYNGVHTNFDPTSHTNVVINSDGNVTFVPPGIFRSSCESDVALYPFDAHACPLNFGSWTLNGGQMNLQLQNEDGADLSSFKHNSEWQILGAPGKVNRVHYAVFAGSSYVDMTFVVYLKRYGAAIFDGASFALWLGSLSIMLSFFMPKNSGQRVAFGVAIVLGLSAMGVSIHVCLGGKHSVLVSYFHTLTLIAFTSIICHVIVTYFYNQIPSISPMPNWLRNIFCEKFPRVLCLPRPRNDSSCRSGSNLVNISNYPDGARDQYEDMMNNIQATLQQAIGIKPLSDWQYFAIVLDRLLGVIYTITISIYFIAFYWEFS